VEAEAAEAAETEDNENFALTAAEKRLPYLPYKADYDGNGCN